MVDKTIICLFLLSVPTGCSSIMKEQDNFPYQKDITGTGVGEGYSNTVSIFGPVPVWVGNYEGILIGSDQNDIATVLLLRKNSTFIWISERKDNRNRKEKLRGNVIIDTKGKVLTLRSKTNTKSFRFNGKTLVPLENYSQSGVNGTTDTYFLTKR